MSLIQGEGEKIELTPENAAKLALHFSRPAEVFAEESLSRKKLAVNAGKKVGAGGRHMTFGYDLMSKKDKKKYMKGSNVVSYNLNEVCTLNSFKMMDKPTQKKLVEHWINNNIISKGKLAKKWELSDWHFKSLIDPLNIEITNPRILATIARVQEAREAMTPERWKEIVEKREQTKRDKEAARLEKEEKKALKDAEDAHKVAAAARAAQDEEARLAAEAAAREAAAALAAKEAEAKTMQQQVQPVQQTYYQAPQQPTYVQPQYNPYQPYQPVQQAPQAPVAALPVAMSFNVTNQPGAVCMDMMNRMLAFMHSDHRNLYKLTITVEEVR